MNLAKQCTLLKPSDDGEESSPYIKIMYSLVNEEDGEDSDVDVEGPSTPFRRRKRQATFDSDEEAPMTKTVSTG